MTKEQEIEDLVERIRPLLAGRSPDILGAALADCLAIWLAGHYVAGDNEATRRLRADLLGNHVARVTELTTVNARIIGTPP
jgi:hypothetical protein